MDEEQDVLVEKESGVITVEKALANLVGVRHMLHPAKALTVKQ